MKTKTMCKALDQWRIDELLRFIMFFDFFFLLFLPSNYPSYLLVLNTKNNNKTTRTNADIQFTLSKQMKN